MSTQHEVYKKALHFVEMLRDFDELPSLVWDEKYPEYLKLWNEARNLDYNFDSFESHSKFVTIAVQAFFENLDLAEN